MSQLHSGSCLCGAVRYAVDGAFEHFYLCHCEYCRKDTGSAHGANLFSSTARLQWLSGADQVRTFNLPSTRHTRSFCTACGSALPTSLGEGQILVVPAGSLDSTLSQRPDAHLFVASKAAWDEDLESLPKTAQFPS